KISTMPALLAMPSHDFVSEGLRRSQSTSTVRTPVLAADAARARAIDDFPSLGSVEVTPTARRPPSNLPILSAIRIDLTLSAKRRKRRENHQRLFVTAYGRRFGGADDRGHRGRRLVALKRHGVPVNETIVQVLICLRVEFELLERHLRRR